MYYNKALGRIILDLFDYFLISVIISIYFTEYLKNYFSEEQKMLRLREDLINKSKLVKSSSQTITSSSATRVQKIFNFALRGGDEKVLFANAEKIKTFVIYLLAFLEKKLNNNNKIFNIIVVGARLYLRFILLVWKIDLTYYVDPVTKEFMVMTMIFGGATGFIISWIGVAVTLIANLCGLTLISRSLVQQLIHILEYIQDIKTLNQYQIDIDNLLKEKKTDKTVVSVAERIENNNQKLKTLNWEQNPALKETAERLGIFEEKPNPRGPIKSTENTLYNRYLEKKKIRKIVEKVVDVEADSDIIDVDFVNEDRLINRQRIKIRDRD